MSFRAEPLKKKANYYSIKDASFRLPSNSDDTEAIRREWKNPKNGTEGVAYERAYKALFGRITDVSFRENTLADGTVLRNINIELGEDENGITQVISLPVDSRYASDFLKRLPNVDLMEEVRLMPYDFEPKEGPRQVGMSISHYNSETQEFDRKLQNFFVKEEIKNGKKTYTNIHGYPEATDEDASDWPFYFKKVNKFLINYTKVNICSQFQDHTPSTKVDAFEAFIDEAAKETPKAEITPEDIPF